MAKQTIPQPEENLANPLMCKGGDTVNPATVISVDEADYTSWVTAFANETNRQNTIAQQYYQPGNCSDTISTFLTLGTLAEILGVNAATPTNAATGEEIEGISFWLAEKDSQLFIIACATSAENVISNSDFLADKSAQNINVGTIALKNAYCKAVKVQNFSTIVNNPPLSFTFDAAALYQLIFAGDPPVSVTGDVTLDLVIKLKKEVSDIEVIALGVHARIKYYTGPTCPTVCYYNT